MRPDQDRATRPHPDRTRIGDRPWTIMTTNQDPTSQASRNRSGLSDATKSIPRLLQVRDKLMFGPWVVSKSLQRIMNIFTKFYLELSLYMDRSSQPKLPAYIPAIITSYHLATGQKIFLFHMLVLTVLPITGLLVQNGVIINWSLANQLGTASITNLVRGTLEITSLITAMEEERAELGPIL